ncbi:unnamed protein product, partial [Ectocarpus sp. 12 AP-2014]
GEIPASLGQLAELELLRLDQDKLSGNCFRRSRRVHVTPDCLNPMCALVGFILKVYRGKYRCTRDPSDSPLSLLLARWRILSVLRFPSSSGMGHVAKGQKWTQRGKA